jgi:hypothetical protein
MTPRTAPAPSPAPTPIPTVQTQPAITDAEGNILVLNPQQMAARNAEVNQYKQQDAQFVANMNRDRKQHEAQQNEAFATAFSNAGFSLPKTQPKPASHRYIREASQPATQE